MNQPNKKQGVPERRAAPVSAPQRIERTAYQQRALARRKKEQAQRLHRRRVLTTLGVAVLLLLLAALIVRMLSPKEAVATPRAETSSVAASAEPSPTDSMQAIASSAAQPQSTPPSKTTQSGEEWMLRLVNANTPLPEDYVPELASLANGKQFDARAIDALRRMLSDGNTQGLSLMVCSAYRSIARQDELFSAMKQDYMSKGYSEEEATRITMTIRTPHACSEHSSGLAADIVAQSYQTLDDGFADTPEARWLFEHAVEYGFILRYPKDKQDVTGIIYEPWHYRYVGVENAKKITDSGLCLEEYLA